MCDYIDVFRAIKYMGFLMNMGVIIGAKNADRKRLQFKILNLFTLFL